MDFHYESRMPKGRTVTELGLSSQSPWVNLPWGPEGILPLRFIVLICKMWDFFLFFQLLLGLNEIINAP